MESRFDLDNIVAAKARKKSILFKVTIHPKSLAGREKPTVEGEVTKEFKPGEYIEVWDYKNAGGTTWLKFQHRDAKGRKELGKSWIMAVDKWSGADLVEETTEEEEERIRKKWGALSAHTLKKKPKTQLPSKVNYGPEFGGQGPSLPAGGSRAGVGVAGMPRGREAPVTSTTNENVASVLAAGLKHMAVQPQGQPHWHKVGVQPGWKEYRDKTTGRYYYVNQQTKETLWDVQAKKAGVITKIKSRDMNRTD